MLERATKVIQEQLDHIGPAVEGMSAIEYDLLRERSGDEHFQDGCLFTFHDRSAPSVPSPTSSTAWRASAFWRSPTPPWRPATSCC
ncbi:hypothetical protein [Streptomyces anulatus]|uniref:hypothetical protein n=1 Tax=Streptomyces anulatus TaxID=1892 RepID=UPI003437BF45